MASNRTPTTSLPWYRSETTRCIRALTFGKTVSKRSALDICCSIPVEHNCQCLLLTLDGLSERDQCQLCAFETRRRQLHPNEFLKHLAVPLNHVRGGCPDHSLCK